MIGIICALEIEVLGLKKKMISPEEKTIAKMTFTKGEIDGREVVAVECGIGKVNAAMCAQVMIDCYAPSVIINSGIAGGLIPEVSVYDMVIADDVVQHDIDGTALGDPPGEIWFNDEKRIFISCSKAVADALVKACTELPGTKIFHGRIATGDVFVKEKGHRMKIGEMFGACACEMEGGAIGQVCYRNDIPFGILRCISDSVAENEAEDFAIFREVAAEKSIGVLLNFLAMQ